MDDLLTRTVVRGNDEGQVSVLKHDVRLATVLARALANTIQRPTGELVVPDGAWRWRIAVEVLRRIVDDVRREAPPHATGRERVRARTVALLQRQAEARRGESPPDSWVTRMGKHPAVRAFLDHAWPALSAEDLVFSLLSNESVLSAAADDVLSPDELRLLLWTRPPRTAKSARWSAADAVLIDEAAGLLERMPSFGHIVLDEAQDLSAMQCRVIARRCEHGSLTILGDLAQGTAPWAARDWQDSLAHLGKPGAHVVPLTTGFRVPAVVLRLANRLLPLLDVEVPSAVSLRQDGLLEVRQVPDAVKEVGAEVRSALAFEGSIAVICADASIAAVADALRELQAEDSTVDSRVTVLPASLAKGLEYDHVIVVEPADIVAAEPRGLARLYVVLTRAVSRLSVLHMAPLPIM